MTLKNNRALLLCYFKLYASFRSHQWIQAGVTVRKRPIWVKIDDFFSHVTLQFDAWSWKTIGHLFYYYFKLCASFGSHRWFQTWSYSPETPNLGQSRWFLEPCDLEIWRITFKNNRASLLCYFKLLSIIKLYALFHHHMWIQTGVTVRKRLSWVVTSVTLTFDLWPWPFAWTLPWSLVITPENFMMIRWW